MLKGFFYYSHHCILSVSNKKVEFQVVILKVFKVFNPSMEWGYYYKFIGRGAIGMTFLNRLFTWNMPCDYLK